MRHCFAAAPPFYCVGYVLVVAWVAGEAEQLTARGNFWREDRWRNGAASGEREFSSERIAGGTELLAAGGNFWREDRWRDGVASGQREFSSERIAGETELLAARGNFLARGSLAKRNS